MYRRYHIPTAPAPSRRPWARVDVLRDLSRCLNCGTCIDSCLYGTHGRQAGDPRYMEEPASHLCRVCFRCVQECPVGALSLRRNKDFMEAGNGLFTPEILRTLSNEAEAGKIPVTGSAFRGPWGGQGFDGMWTDMSEIVRPTRDGIHGREYISTSVDIGARPTFLDVQAGGPWNPPREVPLPVLLDAASPGTPPLGALASIAGAARVLETYAILPVRSMEEIGGDHIAHAILRLEDGEVTGLEKAAGVEVTYRADDGTDLDGLRRTLPHSIVSLRVPMASYRPEAADLALAAGADLLHLTCDWREVETIDGVNRYISTLKALHGRLVDLGRRDAISVLASGPIAAAEHVPKAILLGADLVAADLALYAVLECVPPNHALHLGRFPEDFPLTEAEWGTQRVANLISAWRDQLLEILGAMGMREVRRLRGDVGRAIFQEEAEREAFGDIRVREAARAPAKEVIVE